MELLRGQIIPTERKGKKVSQEDKVAWALETFGEVTGDEFTFDMRIKRYGASIFTLRDEGWVIETLRPQDSSYKKWSFKLISKPPSDESGQRKLAL
tara:strand:- start:18 stop:305 length:288 start_codon:yes stop_codon:yes gene_type:complete